ncbi:Cytochrome P450 [Pleurostoma richardsiae]|uniref:Cytochrome P450 n=1 Tax=Pleurostoma richardsiae TaxID=41990 RepID=A0AA38VB42_9PEZI|nr:Cytochrome P450 [Pleurostoma richardsiae]
MPLTSVKLTQLQSQVLKKAYFTPLRGIPGPWFAKFTPLLLKKNTLLGHRMYYVHKLHEIYGPVVRIAPEEIDISDPAAAKEIHRINSGFLKSDFYSKFRKGDTRDVFSMTDPKDHADRRRMLAPLFSKSALRNNWETSVVEKVAVAVDKMKLEAQTNGSVDIHKWWTFMTADVISHLAFGESFGMLLEEKKTEPMQKIEDATKFGLVSSELLWLCKMLQSIPLKIVQNLTNADDMVQHYAEQTVRRIKQNPLGRTHVFSRLVAEWEKGGGLTEYDLAFEASGFIVAGSGTTAVTLTYLVWDVLSRPKVQEQLEEELAGLAQCYSDADLDSLPYLSAVIEETLRLHGAAPGALPRRTPKGGATLAGYYIPEDVTVCTQAYTLHRDSASYPEPGRYSFRPERFLSDTGGFKPPQGPWFPFGGGSRSCLGIHLARMELRHGAARFFRECRGARLAPRTTSASMAMVNYFLISPASEQCWVIPGAHSPTAFL